MRWFEVGARMPQENNRKKKKLTCPDAFGVCPSQQPWCTALEPMVNSQILKGSQPEKMWEPNERTGERCLFCPSLLSRDWISSNFHQCSPPIRLTIARQLDTLVSGGCFFPLLTALRNLVRLSLPTSVHPAIYLSFFTSSLLYFLNFNCLKNCSTALHPK